MSRSLMAWWCLVGEAAVRYLEGLFGLLTGQLLWMHDGLTGVNKILISVPVQACFCL